MVQLQLQYSLRFGLEVCREKFNVSSSSSDYRSIRAEVGKKWEKSFKPVFHNYEQKTRQLQLSTR